MKWKYPVISNTLKNTFRSFGYTGYGLDPRLPRTPAGVGDPGTYTPVLNGGKSSNATASFIGLLRYTYNNKYTFNGSYRYDGSSMVPETNRWHGFYSAGVKLGSQTRRLSSPMWTSLPPCVSGPATVPQPASS